MENYKVLIKRANECFSRAFRPGEAKSFLLRQAKGLAVRAWQGCEDDPQFRRRIGFIIQHLEARQRSADMVRYCEEKAAENLAVVGSEIGAKAHGPQGELDGIGSLNLGAVRSHGMG